MSTEIPQPAARPPSIPLCAVVALAFEPAWLGLSRSERASWAARLAAILERHPDVSLRWFDADALSGAHTDFALCEFEDLKAYHFLWEELRDLELFSRPYVRIVDVWLGMERGYEAYEAQAARA